MFFCCADLASSPIASATSADIGATRAYGIISNMKAVPMKPIHSLADRIVSLIEASRQAVASAVNLAMVYTYYEIGRQIVEEEQNGASRAGYGDRLLIAS